MHRPVGVSVSAVFLAIVAVLCFFLTIVLAQVASRANIRHPQSTHLIAARAIIAFAVATLYTLWILVGLLRGKRWARLGGIVLGVVLVILALLLLSLTNTLFVMPQLQSTATLSPGLLFAEISYLGIAGIGIWLATYLNTGSVKRFFATPDIVVPNTIAYSTPSFAIDDLVGAFVPPSREAPFPTQIGLGTTLARIVVLIFCVIGTAMCIYSLIHAFSNRPYFYLGISMQGNSTNVFRVCSGALIIALNMGIFLRYIPAYCALLFVQISSITSLLLLFVPAYQARAMQAFSAHASSGINIAHVHNIQVTVRVFYLLISVIFVWALWSDLADLRLRHGNQS